ncbi:MAG: hypothetical protein WCY58_11125 [Mariniphaga sp.]|nr:hypothetical protein [Mariniphaga sp.]MDD4226302.1 hypothetical protein [Mariniphaga sp.]MDD4426183.1 hypothetical protein [Mariniphaga sp.]
MRSVIFRSIAIIFLLASCKSSVNNRGEKHVITIATLKGPSSMGMIWMIDSLANTESSNIKVILVDEPIQVRKMILDGTAGFAVLPSTMAAILYNKGFDYSLVAIPVWGTLYLLGNDTTISNWNDLKNSTVHVMAKGMTPDVLFRYLLMKNNITPGEDITLDYSFPTHIELANAVAAGRANLAVISEPLVSLVMNKNKHIHPLLDLNMEWKKQLGAPMAQTAFLVKKELREEQPLLVEQVLTAYENSTIRVNQDARKAAKLMVNYGILPDTLVAFQSIPGSNLHFVRANEIKKEIHEYLKIFFNMNPEIVGGRLPNENFIR